MFHENIQSYKAFRTTAPVKNWCSDEFQTQQAVNESYWSLDRCIKESAKYPTREQWEQGSPVSYRKAIKRGWLTKCTTHIAGFKRRASVPAVWTLEMCWDLAKQCQTRTQFKKTFKYPYEKCRLNGWLEICCAHML